MALQASFGVCFWTLVQTETATVRLKLPRSPNLNDEIWLLRYATFVHLKLIETQRAKAFSGEEFRGRFIKESSVKRVQLQEAKAPVKVGNKTEQRSFAFERDHRIHLCSPASG